LKPNADRNPVGSEAGPRMKRNPQPENKPMTNDRKGSTYFEFAKHTDEDIYGGRFAGVKTTVVTGSTPGSAFPQMPEGTPWSNDPVGPEPPLGVAIDQQDATGEHHEIAASTPASVGLNAGVVGGTPTPAPESRSAMSPVADGVGVGRARFLRRA